MIKRLVFILSFTTILFSEIRASHLMGGEITWNCVGGGQYVFTMKLYRDCNGINGPGSVLLRVKFHPSVSSIPLSLISQTDISPACNAGGPAISCTLAESQPGWPSSASAIAGAVQESVFQSAPISLPGVPPVGGWHFYYSDCCRNPAITNLTSAGGYGFTLRAVMYAYSGMNANPCFDSSPKFLESPSSVICLGYPYTYNHNAYDPELDSLHYSWAEPLDDTVGGTYNPPLNPAPVPFAATYSYNSPLPGPAQFASNVPATINPATGEISFTSFTQGNFVTVVKVAAWKCGQLVAEIYREMQIVLLPCAPNNPPGVTYTSYSDTVTAGALVNFTLNANDPGFLADGITPQTLTILATGSQFGTGYTSSVAGCSNPPCATLSAAPPVSGATTVSTTFNWQTDCTHISNNTACNTPANTYTFVFKVKDDFCPAPAENISTVSITVLSKPVVLSPQPRCVSVLPSGDVTLTWSSPVDTGGTFNAYMIYSSNVMAGPYTVIDSIFTLGTTTYTHVGANANTAPVYYYIRTRSGCNELSSAIDTVRSMLLNVSNPLNGTAQLNWNTIATPPIPSSTGVYNIYLEYPAGVWTITGTTTSTSFVDTVFVCNAPISYRIEIADATGCISVSSIDGGVFQNLIVPNIPAIDTLSVDDANTTLLNWNVNASTDVIGYVVYVFNGSSFVPVDTVYGINNTDYNYLASNSGIASEQYRLTALDSCGNISPLSTIVSTVFLTADPDICARSAVLSWTSYTNFNTGLAGYRVYQSSIGTSGPWTLIATVPAGTLTATASGLAASTNYYYKVEAYNNAGTKTVSSNRISFFSAIPIPPVFSYLRKVSVLDPDRIDVTCHVDVAASTLQYKIMRSLDTVSANYAAVGTIPAGVVNPIVFSDYNVLTDKKSYYYKIINVDSCGFDGMQTNIGRSILLNAISDSDAMINKLNWNDYEDWSGTVMSYNIYRGLDGTIDPIPIANIPFTASGLNTYTDDISTLLLGEGVFSYYVEALEGMGNTFGFAENSRSNIAEAYQDPKVFIPNAFKPIGFNSIFIPVTTYVDIQEYEFMIFNRWGLQVFSTNDVNTGWDGMHGSSKCEFGVYVYLLRFKTSKGEYIELKGTVTLLR